MGQSAMEKFVFPRTPLIQRDIRFVVTPAKYEFKGADVNLIVTRKPFHLNAPQ